MIDFLKKNKVLVALSLMLLLILCFSLFMYKFTAPGERRVLYFKSMDNNLVVCENRFIRSEAEINDVEALVNEVLLGPMTNRFYRLFPLGTKVNFCFVQDNTLYVDLSNEALLTSSESCSFKEGAELLKENVVKNFTNIDTIHVFVGGISI